MTSRDLLVAQIFSQQSHLEFAEGVERGGEARYTGGENGQTDRTDR